jgi:hypothetical protein
MLTCPSCGGTDVVKGVGLFKTKYAVKIQEGKPDLILDIEVPVVSTECATCNEGYVDGYEMAKVDKAIFDARHKFLEEHDFKYVNKLTELYEIVGGADPSEIQDY